MHLTGPKTPNSKDEFETTTWRVISPRLHGKQCLSVWPCFFDLWSQASIFKHQVTRPQICVPAAFGRTLPPKSMVFFSPTKIGGFWSIGISSILALMMDGNLGDSLRSLDPHDQKTKLEDCHEAAKITIDMVTTEHVYEVLHHLSKKDHIISHQPKFISMMQHINRYCPRTSWISMKTSKRTHTDDNLRCMCFSISQLSCSWPSTKSLPYDGQESANHSAWLIGYLKTILYWLHSLN